MLELVNLRRAWLTSQRYDGSHGALWIALKSKLPGGLDGPELENKLNLPLNNAVCWNETGLKPNPWKTNVCAFHFKNRQARHRLDIISDGASLMHCEMPHHLGVTVDQILTFKRHHCCSLKQKLSTCNNFLRKLAVIIWGAYTITLWMAAFTLCYSAR